MSQPQIYVPGVTFRDHQVRKLLAAGPGEVINLERPRGSAPLSKNCRYYVKEAFTYAETRYTADGLHYVADIHYRADGRMRPVLVSEYRCEQIEAWVGDKELFGDGGDNWQAASNMPKFAFRLQIDVLETYSLPHWPKGTTHYATVRVIREGDGPAPTEGFNPQDENAIQRWIDSVICKTL